MRQTINLALNLMETADLLSAKPLNDNAEAIDTAIKGLQDKAAAADTSIRNLAASLNGVVSSSLKMAAGSYVGDGTRSVTLATPGFRPQIILMSVRETVNGSAGITQKTMISVQGGWCLWIGADIAATYNVRSRSDESYDMTTKTLSAEVSFSSGENAITWSIPALPANYFDVDLDDGPNVVNNRQGVTYDWVAIGVVV